MIELYYSLVMILVISNVLEKRRTTMAGNSGESKKLKRSHAVDRLSHLPDNVIHHILSFLDTKSLVRTSLLSRKWRSLWKHVPALNVLRKSFPNLLSFTKHIGRILATRYRSIPVSSITFDLCGDKWPGAVKIFEKIMKYAESHGGGGGLHHLSIVDDEMHFLTRDVINVITASRHNESLKTLKFERCCLQCGEFDMDFKLLTTLELQNCILQHNYTVESFDPFGNLPCLKYLKLIGCGVYCEDTGLKISGLELLGLEIESSNFYGGYEVIAPKLKALYLRNTNHHPYLPKLNLPALDHANIRLSWHISYGNAASEEDRAFMNFLGSLRNVESLQLRFDKARNIIGQEDHFPLNRIKALIKPEAPPFTRLKTLRLQCVGLKKLPNIHYEVIRYFFEGSLSTEERVVKLELVTQKQT
ncbi:unnamed protein product [Linum tenue]|uniref:F-box domain-containing protein n=1 Tax=Linum tenue TaxID=586396 RepID=A0AAV0GTN4_9ROSI|nr:unnamed protein product [Linum tenue]